MIVRKNYKFNYKNHKLTSNDLPKVKRKTIHCKTFSDILEIKDNVSGILTKNRAAPKTCSGYNCYQNFCKISRKISTID